MSAQGIRRVRISLGLLQPQLAAILGVHRLTVVRWETGKLSPNPFQAEILRQAKKVQAEGCKEKIRRLLAEHKPVLALRALLVGATRRRRAPAGK